MRRMPCCRSLWGTGLRQKKNKQQQENPFDQSASSFSRVQFQKILTIVLAVCALLIVYFCFLAGDQPVFRDSRGDLAMHAA